MGGNKVYELVLLDQAGQALAAAQSFDEIKVIRDKAEAVRKYAQSASLGLDVQNRAAELKLRAEREAGKLLAQMMLRGGDRRSKDHDERLKLDQLGISHNQSTRWQTQARVPEKVFREHIRETCDAGRELTSAGVIRLAKRFSGSSVSKNGSNGKNGDAPDGNGALTIHRSRKWDDSSSVDMADEIVGEIRNHHAVLDGILRPLYGGDAASLRPAELRVLRYLMAEIGGLLAQLDEHKSSERGCRCHDNRAAV
jgi:hypothetical protein